VILSFVFLAPLKFFAAAKRFFSASSLEIAVSYSSILAKLDAVYVSF